MFFGLALGLVQKIPERIDENVIGGRALIFLGPADLTDPVYGCSILCGKANGGPVCIVRNVFLSRTHGSDFY